MSDLADGESVEMQGSGAKPYVLKNTGGIYSCTCPAWRNQSVAIEKRTCKHLRKLRGDEAEKARVGGALPQKPTRTKPSDDGEEEASAEPPLLLAESWDNSRDLAGWWMSEKLDGVRAYWDGRQFLSRQGNLYHAPDWFVEGLPDVPLDGELWIDRKAFQRTVSIVRRQDKSEHWRTVRFVIFDAPQAAQKFEERIEFLNDQARVWQNTFVTIHQHLLCRDLSHLRGELQRIESLGGEGLMLREPGSQYAAGRSTTLVKVKTFHDAEAEVIGHEPGKGRHAGRLGALSVRLPNGKVFSVGTGFSDKQRESPPSVGSLVTFRYQELSDAGIPRFPSYVGVRSDVEVASAPKPKQKASPKSPPQEIRSATQSTSEPTLPGSRYFECHEGTSNKFWEINVVGQKLTTRWGRIGSQGQSKTKTFATSELAWADRDSLVASKLESGYREVSAAPPTEPNGEANPKEPTRRRESEPANDRMDFESLANTVAEQFREPPPTPPASNSPAEIHLVEEPTLQFTNEDLAEHLSSELVAAGYEHVGDYSVQELPVLMRFFWQTPNIVAVVTELLHFVWVDLCIRNADGTMETWSNVPMHDGLAPPWSKVVVQPNADLHELLRLMQQGRSGKKPEKVKAGNIPRLFEESYAKGTAWRAEQAVKPSPPQSSAAEKKIADLVWAFAREYVKTLYDNQHNTKPSGKAILRLPPTEQIQVLRACFVLREPVIEETRHDSTQELREALLKKRLPFSNTDIEFLAEKLVQSARAGDGLDPFILGALEHWAESNSISGAARAILRSARDNTSFGYFTRDAEKLKARIDALIGDDAIRNPIKQLEVWASMAIADIEQMPSATRTAWIKLLQHCVSAPSGKPDTKWIESTRAMLRKLASETVRECLLKWFPLVDKPWPEPRFPAHFVANGPLAIFEGNQDILRGLVWCCSLIPDRQLARAIGSLAVSAYRKIPRVGARAVRVGNACVYVLGAIGDGEAVAQLAMLKVKVKFGTAQRFIEAELDKAATRLGLPREELEEMSVPAYGLEEVGLRRESLGDFTAELRIDASGDATLQWLKADGSPQKSIPASVQKEFADELKELKAAVKDLDKMLPAQRERLDGLALQHKSWPLTAWRNRYLNHPLVGTIARRLIWRFRHGKSVSDGIFHEGKLVDSHDRELKSLGDEATVELWHPIGLSAKEIVAWREWFERHEVRQPFKQAHREVYLLTDTEQRTRVYSNRFAAHVLRQSQFRALASSRGWQTPLLGYWDGGDSSRATRRLPQWNLVAEFWILGLPPGADDANQPPSAGMPLISTDQVRFCRIDDPEPLPLEEVPALVFSEIMRDVDLFVGVASVGNDPNWVDGGPNRQFADYWHSYSFGDLSATAKTRRDVLERLLPRLKIASRCKLGDRFLEVRGDLRTYKIHMGSGNILMAPNDQYLCIVPKPSNDVGTSGQVFLPFDGDRMFSIILSKAFLLAEDSKIKDPTITRQIKA